MRNWQSYEYKTLGGNNSHVALQKLVKERNDPTFRTRLASVYKNLSDDESLRLAAKHNAVTSLHNAVSTSEKVGVGNVCFSCFIVTPRAYAQAGLSNRFCPSVVVCHKKI